MYTCDSFVTEGGSSSTEVTVYSVKRTRVPFKITGPNLRVYFRPFYEGEGDRGGGIIL